MSTDIVEKMTRIADASRREDGSDIPLGEQCRSAAAIIVSLRQKEEALQEAVRNVITEWDEWRMTGPDEAHQAIERLRALLHKDKTEHRS